MKIALMVGRFGGGTGTGGVAEALARFLVDRGHRVGVWCRLPADVSIPGVELAPLGPRQLAADRVPRGFVRLALDRVPGCEVARASGGVHRAWLAVRGRPVGPRDLWEAALDRWTARTARRVICNSSRVAGEVVAYHGVPGDRVTVVRTGVDPRRFRPDPLLRARIREQLGAGEGRIAMFVGHGFRRKGLETAIEAFARAAGPQDRLVVLGHDAHAGRWLRPAQQRLGERLCAVGAARTDQWLPAADALILPSRYDAASNAVLEALAAGVPAVVSARDGAAEAVADRRLVVGDPGDVEGFARALRYAWEGGPSAGAARPERARSSPDWPDVRMAERVERILVETAHG